ncbi:MAG: Fe-S cluster assembly protein SufB [Rickettsiales bacterium]|jgi:Fe-S cluster assembly protein SufB|nr:Fe-S cluster assembly protein SufB [Rickettsiales bacterium]
MRKPDENLIREISRRRDEPDWLLSRRLAALDKWLKMPEPHWAEIGYEPIDYNALNYFNEPRPIDNADLAEAYAKMGLPEEERRALLGMATDTVIDSKSVHTSYTEELGKLGIIFLPFSEAVRKEPELVKKYLGTVVPPDDNFFAALNAAAFSDGTFVYIPKNTTCPIDLASYFRIETATIGQFERTLIIADEGSKLSYMEGCSAPRRPNHQLHSGVVEIAAMDKSDVRYATVQNWANNIYNFVTKRARVEKNAKVFWTQMEIGSAKTWKYPSSVLCGENAFSDFYSLTITRDTQQADTGTKMIHIAPTTKSNIVSFGVATGKSKQTFRSLVKFGADGCANASKCDSKIIGNGAAANTIPTFISIRDGNYSHEAKTGALDKDALFYLAAAGIGESEASALLVAGMAAPVLERLPMEFLVESKQLIQMAMEK